MVIGVPGTRPTKKHTWCFCIKAKIYGLTVDHVSLVTVKLNGTKGILITTYKVKLGHYPL